MTQANWIKHPSVRAGGKPYFYVNLTGIGNKITVMWDKQSESWGISHNDSLTATGYLTANKAIGTL